MNARTIELVDEPVVENAMVLPVGFRVLQRIDAAVRLGVPIVRGAGRLAPIDAHRRALCE